MKYLYHSLWNLSVCSVMQNCHPYGNSLITGNGENYPIGNGSDAQVIQTW